MICCCWLCCRCCSELANDRGVRRGINSWQIFSWMPTKSTCWCSRPLKKFTAVSFVRINKNKDTYLIIDIFNHQLLAPDYYRLPFSPIQTSDYVHTYIYVYYHHSCFPSLLHLFVPGLRHVCLTNPSHHRLILTYQTDFMDSLLNRFLLQFLSLSFLWICRVLD